MLDSRRFRELEFEVVVLVYAHVLRQRKGPYISIQNFSAQAIFDVRPIHTLSKHCEVDSQQYPCP